MKITNNKIKREIRKAKKSIASLSGKLGDLGYSYNGDLPPEGHKAHGYIKAIKAESDKIFKLEGMIPPEQRSTKVVQMAAPRPKTASKPKGKRIAPGDSFYNSRQWRQVRYKALKFSDGRCDLCGRSKHDGALLHVDHIKPRSKRPDLELVVSNLQILCDSCNLGKSNTDDTDWRGLPEKIEKIIASSNDNEWVKFHALPLLRQLPEGHCRQGMFKALAARLGLDLDGAVLEVVSPSEDYYSRLKAQVNKLKNMNCAEVTDLEKQKLREILQEKQKRDAGIAPH